MNILKKEDFDIEKEITNIEKKYNINTAIILNNIGRPKYIYIDGDKNHKICRFCGKDEKSVTFLNKSHVVPKFLGNFLIISNFECDECNSYFSKYETELEKFIRIPLIANLKDKDLKNRYGKNIKRIDNEIIINGQQEKVEFNSLYVLKIFLKFAYSMLSEKEIDNFKNIKNVLLNDNIPNITDILDITCKNPFDFNSIILYEKKDNIDNFVNNILVMNFNMKKYIIFFDKDDSILKINGDIINDNYINLFKDLDVYNYRIRNFQNDKLQIKFNIDIFMQFIKYGIF